MKRPNECPKCGAGLRFSHSKVASMTRVDEVKVRFNCGAEYVGTISPETEVFQSVTSCNDKVLSALPRRSRVRARRTGTDPVLKSGTTMEPDEKEVDAPSDVAVD